MISRKVVTTPGFLLENVQKKMKISRRRRRGGNKTGTKKKKKKAKYGHHSNNVKIPIVIPCISNFPSVSLFLLSRDPFYSCKFFVEMIPQSCGRSTILNVIPLKGSILFYFSHWGSQHVFPPYKAPRDNEKNVPDPPKHRDSAHHGWGLGQAKCRGSLSFNLKKKII